MIFVQPIASETPKSNVNLSSLGCHISNGVWITLTYNMLLFLFNNNARCDSSRLHLGLQFVYEHVHRQDKFAF